MILDDLLLGIAGELSVSSNIDGTDIIIDVGYPYRIVCNLNGSMIRVGYRTHCGMVKLIEVDLADPESIDSIMIRIEEFITTLYELKPRFT